MGAFRQSLIDVRFAPASGGNEVISISTRGAKSRSTRGLWPGGQEYGIEILLTAHARKTAYHHRHWEDTMRIASLAAVGAVGFTMLLTQGAAATAAEVNVMAGNALARVIGELGP
jgi:hypothetical protein